MEPLTLTELGVRMARRWRLLLAGGLVGLAIGVTAHTALPARYEATTVLHVDAADPSTVDMAAEEAVATSRRVTSEALDALGETPLTIRDLERATRASAVAESRLLRITFSAGGPRAATRGADAVAHAYLAARYVDATDGRAAPAPSVVDPARTPVSPVGPGLLPTALGTGVLGLLVAAAPAARPTRTRAAPAS